VVGAPGRVVQERVPVRWDLQFASEAAPDLSLAVGGIPDVGRGALPVGKSVKESEASSVSESTDLSALIAILII
jgi:hypothetical protein